MNGPIICWTVPSSFKEGTVRDFLKHEKNMSSRTFKVIKKEGRMEINDTEALGHSIVHTGDRVTLHFPPEHPSPHFQPIDMPLHILYEDDHLLFLNKPAGVATLPGRGEKGCSIGEAVLGYYERTGHLSTFHAISRLDRQTSGILAIAKHRYSHDRWAQLQRQGIHQRTYLAVVHGKPKAEKGWIEAPITRKENSLIEHQVGPDGKPARTKYAIIATDHEYSLVEVQPEQGRTHQIRVHMASIGHPLAGDDLYGGEKKIIRRQALHAWKLDFLHPVEEQRECLRAPLPDDFNQVLSRWNIDV